MKLFTDELKNIIHKSEAMRTLDMTFGDCFKRKPLSREQIKAFLACHIAGVRDVPTSILTLALRLSHECMKYDYFSGHAIAARTLFAATHEYGLQNTEEGIAKTHFELYRDAIHSWGFTEREILNHQDVFAECVELANFNEEIAQQAPIGIALGCHLALEETADREFYLLWEGFLKYWKEYGLQGPHDPALGFYHIHIIQEPLHGDKSVEALNMYLSLTQCDTSEIIQGVKAYLAKYQQWIQAFYRTFFNVEQKELCFHH